MPNHCSKTQRFLSLKKVGVPLLRNGSVTSTKKSLAMSVLDEKIQYFKQTIKQKLIDVPTSFEEQSKLIKYLKILDPDSDPAWDCITAYHCWLEDVLWQLQNKHYNQGSVLKKNVFYYLILAIANEGQSIDRIFAGRPFSWRKISVF